MLLKVCLFVFFTTVLSGVTAYRILGVFPHPGMSHFAVFAPLMDKLAEKGHEVTVISHFPKDKPAKGYRDVSLRGTEKLLNNFIELTELRNHSRELKIFGAFPLGDFAKGTCETLGSKAMQDFLKTPKKFDLILIEMWTTDCYLGLVHKFQAPFVGLSSCVIMPWINDRIANIEHPAYVPVMFMDYSDDLSFIQRVENTVMLIFNKIARHFLFELPGREAARKYIDERMPTLSSIAENTSLLLVNTHFTLNRPRPSVPAVIEVGGMHIKPQKTLPKSIEKWINESKNGVIYFSMGSMIKGHSFPADTRRAFLKAFARLPQRVLWKWENESLPEKPDNVMIQKWMPQFDILCHPNVRAYISHGGLLGTTEAVHCGVPMVVMPQYGDQFVNAAALEASGGGVILDFKEATEETIYDSLKTILEPSFRDKVKRLSAAFKDRPMSPLDTAVYWVEYVARHNGAHHMKTKAVGMPWYQYLLLDVVAFLLFVILTVLALSFYCLRMTFRLLLGGTKKVKTN